MKNKKIPSKMIKRSFFLLFIFATVAVILVIALMKIQIFGYDDYQKNVIEQLTVETNVNPLRGEIYDRNGTVLATNKTVWILYLLPKNIKNPEFISKELSIILNCSYEDILSKAKKTGYKYQVIDKNLEIETAVKIREFIDKNNLSDQIQLNASSKRYYPYSNLASHALGFVNSDGIGIYGLEKTYNNIMEGTSGKYITAQDAQSNDMPFQYETYIEDKNGYNLVTTIDLYIQYQLEAQLEIASIEAGAQNRSAGIVMNPKTGEIYAMAVYPDFNLNEPYTLDILSQEKLNGYTKGTKEYNNEYMNLVFSMWNNKAVTELYEPGSTFKLITTSVALQEKAASTNSMYTCTGALKIEGYYRPISCHKRTGHGTINFAQALQQSCNPSMMKLAFSIGKTTFYDYFERFGFTSKTGIDLPSETKGYFHSFSNFSNVSLAVYSFGQTFKTTAIQQLKAISVVANGGYSITPHFIKSVIDNEGNIIYEHQNELGNKILDTEVCKEISQILKEGVDGEGGAKNAYVSGYSIAAKTGTSEKKDKYDSQGNTSYRVSSCIAYAPSEDAQVAVIFIVDEPTVGSKYGSVVAAPYVSNLMELILPYLGCEAKYSDKDLENQQIEVGNYIDLTVEEAEKLLKEEKIEYEIVGDGVKITSQMPSQGSKIFKKSGKVILYTSNYEITHTTVPKVVGLTPEKANMVLINSGLNIEIDGAENFAYGKGATIVEQSIVEGTYVQVGTVVKIKILYTDEKE